MQAEKQQTWKINVQAKSKNFDFKYQATQTVPTWNFHRLSISLRLRKFFLRVNSESAALVPRRQQQQKQTLKSKFLRIVQKIRFCRTKKRDISHISVSLSNRRYPEAVKRLKRFASEGLISAGNLVNEALGFLPQSITRKHKKGVIRYSLVILLLLMVAVFTSPAGFVFNSCLKYFGEYVWDYIIYIGNAWGLYAASWV